MEKKCNFHVELVFVINIDWRNKWISDSAPDVEIAWNGAF